MFDFYQKRKIRTIINSPFTQGILLILTLVIGWSAYVRYDVAMEMRDRRIEAEQQLSALEARKDALKEKVEYLSSERGQEAEMRRQFDISLPGEKVVVIVEEEASGPNFQPLSTSTDKKIEVKEKWYQFWR